MQVAYGFQQQLNHAIVCTYFEDINNYLLIVCRGPANIQMLLSFPLCMFAAIQFVAAVYSRDINVLLHHTETKQVQIMTWFSWPWSNLHLTNSRKKMLFICLWFWISHGGGGIWLTTLICCLWHTSQMSSGLFIANVFIPLAAGARWCVEVPPL